jgi:hypothetical protein
MLVDGAATDPAVDEQLFKLRGVPEATARLRRAVAGNWPRLRGGPRSCASARSC